MRENLQEMAELFRVLGDANRLRIIGMLASLEVSDLCVLDLAQQLGISQPAASQHLKILKNAGLLNSTRKGFRVYYTLNLEAFRACKEDTDALYQVAFEKCDDRWVFSD